MGKQSGRIAGLKHHAHRLKDHGVTAARRVHAHALSTPKKIIISSIAAFLVLVVVAQFLYPSNNIVWFAKLDGISIGGKDKNAAIKEVNTAYAQTVAPVYYKDDASEAKELPKLSDIGVSVDNKDRVAAFTYPWYWRLVPSSVLWYNAVARPGPAVASKDADKLNAYMDKTFGAECIIAPKNATIAAKDGSLTVVDSSDGGTCNYDELHGKLEAVGATLSPEKIIVEGTTIKPEVSDDTARKVLQDITDKVGDGVVVAVNGKDEIIAKATINSWFTFAAEGNSLIYSLNEAGIKWLSDTYGKSVAIAAGTSKVTTRDFVETARVDGPSGRAINAQATGDSIIKFIKGDVAKAEVQTVVVPPMVSYTRSYSPTDTGITALLKHFAESHQGTYGISFVELSGARRHANYNGDTQFITASTYKLFVAYSSLLRIEKGEWSWSDQINGGRDLSRCFDDMIVKSDNACAEALLRKIGFTNITNEAKAIGASRTSFLGSDGIKSTAQDQAVLLSALQSGQILSQQGNRDILLNAMKRNIYRKGIPAGATGTVANKVGFMDALLHDAGVVYSPTGTYVLVVLTNESSWANIADLTRQLETLRNG